MNIPTSIIVDTLSSLAKFDTVQAVEETPADESVAPAPENGSGGVGPIQASTPGQAGFHYNIQIHLPATTDISVYNAIFKSLKDNLLI